MLSKSKPLKIVPTFILPAQVCSAEDTSLRSADGKFIKVAQIANCQKLDKYDKVRQNIGNLQWLSTTTSYKHGKIWET